MRLSSAPFLLSPRRLRGSLAAALMVAERQRCGNVEAFHGFDSDWVDFRGCSASSTGSRRLMVAQEWVGELGDDVSGDCAGNDCRRVRGRLKMIRMYRVAQKFV